MPDALAMVLETSVEGLRVLCRLTVACAAAGMNFCLAKSECESSLGWAVYPVTHPGYRQGGDLYLQSVKALVTRAAVSHSCTYCSFGQTWGWRRVAGFLNGVY